ncbi:MAG: ROK family protein [Lachnospiraceae bacterium]|nr:ROK family protein [Lachnospiraceae bacterium]
MSRKFKKYYIGVDVGGTSIKFGVFGQNGTENKKFITKFSVETSFRKRDAERLITKDIFNAIDNYIEINDIGMTKRNIYGIGYAIPGPVVKNTVVRAVNINWKKKYDLVGATKRHYGKNVNVIVLNDGNAAALGEYNYYLKGKYQSMCLMTLGTAVGIGIIIDGKLVEGKHGIAGELSHLKVDHSKDALKCNCGNHGCLETVTGGKGIANVYNRMYHTNTAKVATDVIWPARKGNKKALAALEHSLGYLSMAISIIMLVYEPEIILIGGGVSYEGKFIIDIIKKKLKDKVFITRRLPKIVIAKLKNQAGMYGVVSEL